MSKERSFRFPDSKRPATAVSLTNRVPELPTNLALELAGDRKILPIVQEMIKKTDGRQAALAFLQVYAKFGGLGS